jgi:hypothetical protein
LLLVTLITLVVLIAAARLLDFILLISVRSPKWFCGFAAKAYDRRLVAATRPRSSGESGAK